MLVFLCACTCSRRVQGVRYLKSLVAVDGRVLRHNQMATVRAICENKRGVLRLLQRLSERPALEHFVQCTRPSP